MLLLLGYTFLFVSGGEVLRSFMGEWFMVKSWVWAAPFLTGHVVPKTFKIRLVALAFCPVVVVRVIGVFAQSPYFLPNMLASASGKKLIFPEFTLNSTVKQFLLLCWF